MLDRNIPKKLTNKPAVLLLESLGYAVDKLTVRLVPLGSLADSVWIGLIRPSCLAGEFYARISNKLYF